MKTNIGIPDKNRQQTADILSIVLADEHVLYMKTRNAHWNVRGRDFHAMHLFFESQYKELEGVIDEVAERIKSIGYDAPGSLAAMLKLTKLKELSGDDRDSVTFIKALLADHETLTRELRKMAEKCQDLGDDGSNDFLIGLLQIHEKMAWMLRASLE
ncbi:starvation-inducible DNA-binding protein [Prosthecobacter debontii]|uniref:Starvation-inducible DNA-binding protein n=1 Tax=Prosthecobacter debontii TaxID=48467 RepID=A0A1T4Z144_9BACT|nr:Dps family protein [Prosthecobacter debontii]SKB07770.1 starvation-inducible DNA-binding protein [Prosthecobacter debontii]